MATVKKVIPLKKSKSLASVKAPRTISELKRKYKDLPLHYLFGIEKEIDHQCDSIDDYIAKIKRCQQQLQRMKKAKNLEEVHLIAVTAQYEIINLPVQLDEITRINFEKLRAYAEAWKQLAIEAMNSSKQPEQFVKL